MWNYRVIEFVAVDGNPYRGIHEVYYDDKGEPNAYTEEATGVVWDVSEIGAASEILNWMKLALDEEVLVEADFYNREENTK